MIASSPLNQKINNLRSLFLFLALFFLPFQLGKHFWPSFSYILGQRVDYISPTLYVSDICIFGVFLLSFTPFFRRVHPLFYITLLTLSIGIFFSSSPLRGWYTLLKLIEFVFFAWTVLQEKKIWSFLFWSFLPGLFLEGTLGVLEFVRQASLNGLWYFFGERFFTAATPGIANASIHGQLVLRPYATFPHPNVFAGYLVIVLLFLLLWTFSQKINTLRLLGIVLLTAATIVLLLTLSRVAVLVWLLLFFALTVIRFFRSKLALISLLFLAIVLGSLFLLDSLLSGRFLAVGAYTQALYLRELLQQASFGMILSHPFFGVGLGNFLVVLPEYLSSQMLFGFLQPVHNIFLLVLSETGIVGFVLFLFVLLQGFVRGYHQAHESSSALALFPVASLFVICLIGLSDHYFLTLQQGQLLFALILGLSLGHGTIQLWPFTKSSQPTRSIKS